MIPLARPNITELEIAAVCDVLRSSRLSLGPQLPAFESSVAAYVQVSHAIAVSSGTAGLHLCLVALGIGAGDEVIVPSFAFIAAANAIRYVGAIPVFVDVDADTLNLDPAQVAAAITRKTRALMVVHTFGVPADMPALMAIAERHQLRVIEDACEALGATWDERSVGSFGDAAVFAFYANKQITTGEGGMIVTRDPDLARQMRALRNQGRYETDDWLQHSLLGYNYRLSELHCALGVVQMSRIDDLLHQRRRVAQQYAEALRDCPWLRLPQEPSPPSHMSWFVYVVQLDVQAPCSRDEVIWRLHAGGVQCARYFAPIHRQPAYRDVVVRSPLPVTEAVSRQTIALPFFPTLTSGEIRLVAEQLQQAIDAG